MPIGLVAGYKQIATTRAAQLYTAIPIGERAKWRIFYFNEHGLIIEYTRTNFNNKASVNVSTQTHCVIHCHGKYNSRKQYRSLSLSYWDHNHDEAEFNTDAYVRWLSTEGVSVKTIIVAACYAGCVGVLNGDKKTPIQKLVAVRPGLIQADGPNSSLMGLNGSEIQWQVNTPRVNWTRFHCTL